MNQESQPPQGHDSVAVANHFIDTAARSGRDLCSVTKLIKLVYIAHGYHLAMKDKNLIRDEVVAWPYGPVIVRVYDAFKREPPVPEPLERSPAADSSTLDATALNFVGYVHKGYGHMNFLDLSALTHKPGTPWDMVWRQRGQNAVISNDLIKEYYRGVIEEDAA